jgi:hypothetical protein
MTKQTLPETSPAVGLQVVPQLVSRPPELRRFAVTPQGDDTGVDTLLSSLKQTMACNPIYRAAPATTRQQWVCRTRRGNSASSGRDGASHAGKCGIRGTHGICEAHQIGAALPTRVETADALPRGVRTSRLCALALAAPHGRMNRLRAISSPGFGAPPMLAACAKCQASPASHSCMLCPPSHTTLHRPACLSSPFAYQQLLSMQADRMH